MKKILLLLLLVWLDLSLTFSQDQKLVDPQSKTFFDKNKELGGDVTIKNSFLTYSNGIVTKIFEVESPYSGDFYFVAWLSTVQLPIGEIMKYAISVNNKPISDILPKKNDWHCAGIGNDKTVKLLEGINTIAFSCPAPETPQVEFVRLVRDINKAIISSSNYDAYNEKIAIDMQNYKSAPIDTTTLNLKSAPLAEYQVKEDVYSYYAYYATYYFTSGQVANISTTTSGYEHVIELFSSSNPASYSWSTYGNTTGSLSVNIPATGYYYFRLRNWRNSGGATGIATININGTIINNAQIAGNALALSANYNSTIYNFFACQLESGDSRIWLEGAQGSIPGPIVAFNDDYSTSGDYLWGYQSRVKGAFSNGIRAILLSSYSSYNPITQCDLYGYVPNAPSNVLSSFDNLKADDAMKSAPQSDYYNCISYSGGITPAYETEDVWVWPPSDYPWSNGYSTPPAEAFDNFYENIDYNGNSHPRYTGAHTYFPDLYGVIGVWYNPNYWGTGSGDYTHASVAKPGNYHSHGYDWESKPGSLARTFHPEHALWGINPFDYGYITRWYTYSPLAKFGTELNSEPITYKESVDRGLTVIDKVTFTVEEKRLLDSLKDEIDLEIVLEFNSKYLRWRETWTDLKFQMQSNPFMYTNSEEYSDFFDFCKFRGKQIWPLLFKNYENGHYLEKLPIMQLTKEENKEIYKETIKELDSKKCSKEGKYISTMPRRFDMTYIKKLLTKLDTELKLKNANINTIDKEINEKLDNYLNVYPNPASSKSSIQIIFNLKSEDHVNLDIFDINGKLLANLLNNRIFPRGNNIYRIDLKACSNLNQGIYIFKLKTSTSVQTSKISIID